MGTSKTEQFSAAQNELAQFAKAFSHPARIAILQSLSERGTCVCGEIVSVVGLAQATVSQHLKAMKDLGLIKGRVEGKSTCYCIDREAFLAFRNKMNQLFSSISECC
jgi:DNA-binding transcriptional ArsR family regulator